MQFKNQIKTISNHPIFWIFLFIAGTSPFALNYIMHYVDELHYTDAAIQMLNSNDYFTPKQTSGEPRFLKPIFSYWMIACSYKILGISQFSSRIPFLTSGIILLWITYKISATLTKNKEISLLSVLIIASNPLFILSSSRSIPDIPQALFLAIAILGTAGILASESPQKKDLWLFYLGFSFAFATKGIPAAIFMIISVAFLIFNPWKKIRFVSLINWYAITTSLFIALWWYILMYFKHGNEFLVSFLNDQIGNRILENHFRILKNLTFSILTLFGYFIFWIIPIIKLRRKIEWVKIKTHSPMYLFTILTLFWLAFLFLTSIFTIKFYDRYFLPVFPLLAITIAFTLQSNSEIITNKYYGLTNKILITIGCLISFSSIVIAVRLENILIAATSLFTFLTFLYIYHLTRKNISLESSLKITSILILIISLSLTILISNVAFPDQGSQIANYIKEHKINQEEIVFYGEKKVAAKIQVACGEKIIQNCDNVNNSLISLNANFTIYREDQKPHILIYNNTTEIISTEWMTFPIISFFTNKNIDLIAKQHQINYKIATIKHFK